MENSLYWLDKLASEPWGGAGFHHPIVETKCTRFFYYVNSGGLNLDPVQYFTDWVISSDFMVFGKRPVYTFLLRTQCQSGELLSKRQSSGDGTPPHPSRNRKRPQERLGH